MTALIRHAVTSLVSTFKTNYPGELLDADTAPPIRLLSLVHEGLKPGQTLKWAPWQFRLSARQYQERMEAKSAKAVRSELQLLSHAFFDDTPEINVENHALSPAWLMRIQTVFRNALALCQAAHLSNLKAFDKKIADLCLTQPDSNLPPHCYYAGAPVRRQKTLVRLVRFAHTTVEPGRCLVRVDVHAQRHARPSTALMTPLDDACVFLYRASFGRSAHGTTSIRHSGTC